MSASLEDNRTARDTILARVRKALGKKLPDAQAKAKGLQNGSSKYPSRSYFRQ